MRRNRNVEIYVEAAIDFLKSPHFVCVGADCLICSLHVSRASDFMLCIGAAVAEPAGRSLHVRVGGASETF